MIPTVANTSYQLLTIVALLLPGVVFGSTLQRLRGPTPEDKDASTKILRAIAVGAGFDVIYALILGPLIVDLAKPTPGSANGILSAFARSPREVAFWTLILAGVIPALAAYVVHLQATIRENPQKKKSWARLWAAFQNTYRTVPTSWDYIAGVRGGCFVRIRLADGEYIGGWVGAESYVSGYPESRDIFISSQWAVNKDGVFLHKIEDTLGFYLAIPDGAVVEWVGRPKQRSVSAVAVGDKSGEQPKEQG
ncbi:hypothetical protein GCM10017786_13070 [Amycolatopsis deserti]|uniref:Uncharacterized protein n=1 Tax=Amycolatopsis deserti TaxID=185696 RepID=A0ABQ3ILZ2_9PSEU|nr:hypothetical protein GCM10017786_13070 [Amycolatopsis deserti]